jgi:hypothetical protein
VASSFAVGFSSRSGRSRDRCPDRDARVFRPRSRDADPSCGMDPAIAGLRRPRTPCAHRLGERTKKQSLGRVMSSRCQPREPPGLPCLVRETRDSLPATGVNARRREPPRAFHGFELGSMVGQTGSPDTTTEGRSPVSRPSLALGTLAARRMADGPVRALTFSVARRRALVKASRPRSDPSPGCLEFRFYNRRCASRAPAGNITFGDRPPSAVGKPAIARLLGSPSGSRRLRRTEGDAGPPRGHPASNGRALDGVLPASGRSTVTFMLGGMGRGRASLLFRLAAALSDRAL